MTGYINRNPGVWTLPHNKLQPQRTVRYTGSNRDVNRFTGKKFCALCCSQIVLPSTDRLTQFCEGVIAPNSDENPRNMNFSSSFIPIDLRSFVPNRYYPSSQRGYDGRYHILFYDKHGDKQTWKATNAGRGSERASLALLFWPFSMSVSVSGYTYPPPSIGPRKVIYCCELEGKVSMRAITFRFIYSFEITNMILVQYRSVTACYDRHWYQVRGFVYKQHGIFFLIYFADRASRYNLSN